jgi:hypothetical protein
MITFVTKLITLLCEWYKARRERAIKAWLLEDKNYEKLRPTLSDDSLSRSVDELLEKSDKKQ